MSNPTLLAGTRLALVLLSSATGACIAQPGAAPGPNRCGEVMTLATHASTTTRYALASVPGAPAREAPIALLLLVGGGGNIDLDDQGCPRSLSGNVLMRMRATFGAENFNVALVDAPSDFRGGDGLAAFRTAPQHAEDLGKVIADVRARTKAPVWLAGHSRGTISAVNAAVRLSGPAAPDGLVLLSAMMVGEVRARKPLAMQTVFDLRLESITVPVLVVGHAADNCTRSPAGLMKDIAARTGGVRGQVAMVTGGPISPGRPSNLTACEVREPHDFVDQESEIAAGMVRFIRGGSY